MPTRPGLKPGTSVLWHLLQVIDRLIDQQGVEAVILGGTELPLVLTDESHRRVPLLDTTRIHVEAALQAATG